MKKNILLFSCFSGDCGSQPESTGNTSHACRFGLWGSTYFQFAILREEGKFTSGMSTQALLGMPVKVLQYNGWYEIQTPDDLYRMGAPDGNLPPCRKNGMMNGIGQKR